MRRCSVPRPGHLTFIAKIQPHAPNKRGLDVEQGHLLLKKPAFHLTMSAPLGTALPVAFRRNDACCRYRYLLDPPPVVSTPVVFREGYQDVFILKKDVLKNQVKGRHGQATPGTHYIS